MDNRKQKPKVIKRAEAKTRTKPPRLVLMEKRRDLIRQVKEIERELQTV